VADVLLFHHAQGLTRGVESFADRLRGHGHRVTTPDLYGGRVFHDLDEGVAYAQSVGMEAIVAAGVSVAQGLSGDLVYAGFSLGALPAQALAQTRPGARAAVLYHGGEPAAAFGASWPRTVALQVHYMEGDEWVEPDVVRDLTDGAAAGELYVYPGSGHLFTDESLDAYDAAATALVVERTLTLLDRAVR
jgi:dienelactone hydrolase